MDLVSMRNELITYRFNAGQATSMTSWLNLKYQELWSADVWPFRVVPPTTVTVTSGNIGTVSNEPTDMHKPLRLFDDRGYPLEWLTQKDFFDVYQASTNPGTPQHWTTVNGQIYVGPGPTSSLSYKLSYTRRISRLVAGTTDTTGVMVADTDVPTFPSEYHYLLVFGAMSLGQRLLSDPTYQANEEVWQEGLQLMRSDLLPADQPENSQYGRLAWV